MFDVKLRQISCRNKDFFKSRAKDTKKTCETCKIKNNCNFHGKTYTKINKNTIKPDSKIKKLKNTA